MPDQTPGRFNSYKGGGREGGVVPRQPEIAAMGLDDAVCAARNVSFCMTSATGLKLCLLNDELIALPNTAGYPKPAVDNLSVTTVSCLYGAEHAKAVLSGINLLGALRAEEGIEDVAWAREGAASSHLEAM